MDDWELKCLDLVYWLTIESIGDRLMKAAGDPNHDKLQTRVWLKNCLDNIDELMGSEDAFMNAHDDWIHKMVGKILQEGD